MLMFPHSYTLYLKSIIYIALAGYIFIIVTRTDKEHPQIIIDLTNEKLYKLLALGGIYTVAQYDVGIAFMCMIILFITDYDVDVFARNITIQ